MGIKSQDKSTPWVDRTMNERGRSIGMSRNVAQVTSFANIDI